MTINKKELLELMEDYGNTRHMLEALKSERESLITKILSKYPEAFQEIQDAEDELDTKIEEAELVEKRKKKILQAHAEEYASSLAIKDKAEIKSELVRVGFERKIEYDSAALDGLATENTKLLAFRKEKMATRITLNGI